MAAENVKILITKYDWSGQAEIPYDASIFSDLTPVVTPADFDLMDYLLDEELLIRWDIEFIHEDYNSDKLLPMGSEVSLKCSNVDLKPANFFRVYFPTALIKWKAEILYKVDGSFKKIFEGWITPEGVEYAESGDIGHDTNVVILRIKDYIVEMKDYFSNVPLKSVNEIDWAGHTSFGIRTTSFSKLLIDLFPGVKFTMEDSIANWSVMETPSFHKYENGNIDFWKSGYNRAYENGDMRYDFLRRICNAMGWVFFSYVNEDSILTVQIKNRAGSSFDSVALDSNDMIEYSRSKELNNNNYDVVLILNGTMEGGDLPFTISGNGSPGAVYYPQLKGERTIIVSNKHEPNFNCNHYDGITVSGNSIRFKWSNIYKMQKYRSEDEGRFSLYNISRAGGTGGLIFPPLFISQEKILRVDAGSTGSFAMKVNVDTLVNKPHTIGTTAFDHAEMIFTGNYGEMLTKPEIMYDDYVKSSRFKENFKPFMSNMENLVIRYVHSGIIAGPRATIRGGDGQSILYGRFWDIAAMEVDLINEVTSLELIGHGFTYS